jgi:hypothetical protein
MADLTLKWNEKVIGEGHPWLPPTVGRVEAVETDPDGHGKFRYYKEQATPPETGPGQVCIFCMRIEGELVLFYREENNGEVKRLGSAVEWVRLYSATITFTNTAGPKDFVVPIDDVGDWSQAHVRLLGPSGYSLISEAGAGALADPNIRPSTNTDEIIINVLDYNTPTIRFNFSLIKLSGGAHADHYSAAIQAPIGGWNNIIVPINDIGDKLANLKADIVPGTLTDLMHSAGAAIQISGPKFGLNSSTEALILGYQSAAGYTRDIPFSVITYP